MSRCLLLPSSLPFRALLLLGAALLATGTVACSASPVVTVAPPAAVVAPPQPAVQPDLAALPAPSAQAALAAQPVATAMPAASTALPAAAPSAPKLGVPDSPRSIVAAPAAPSPTPQPRAAGKRVVLGYYVTYDETSWASFQARADSLDYVGAQWVTVDACGNVGSRDDRTLVAYAESHGVKVLPSLLTSSGWLNHHLLADRATADRFVSNIVSYVVDAGYPGIDLDLEGIDDEDRDAFSDLVARVAEALHQRGKILTLAIPAKTSDVRTGWGGPYDYAALGRSADLILLMTYDYSWQSGPSGSIAPQDWVDKVAAYAASQMPAEKVLAGIAFYGYDWNKTQGGKARALIYPQAAALASQYGTSIATDPATRSASLSYTAKPGDAYPLPPSLPDVKHDISVRPLKPCSVPTPSSVPTPRPTPVPASPQQHVVWLEDATSIASRLQIAVGRSLGGVGAWRLGQEDPAVWPLLDAYRAGR